MTDPRSLLAFINELEKLKSVKRTAWTAAGEQESTAEHSWRLAMLALIMAAEYPQLDQNKLLAMSLIHDLGEIDVGDISAAEHPDPLLKHQAEAQAVQRLTALLPAERGTSLFTLWKEYNEAVTAEARLIKALDKAETILQHNQGHNPENFDYRFNLLYGQEYFMNDPLLTEIRRLIDEETRNKGGLYE